ncbi:MAG: hypothetical protein JHC95_17605 [Solirubrobacteraceae bacterium]|nr:hypothetical protein [Solirubrobacteraceae bacterium]
MRATLSIAAAIATCGVLAAPAGAALTQPETLQLDAYGPSGTIAGPVQTAEPLAAGVAYTVRVAGTMSLYNPDAMLGKRKFQVCGAPLAQPVTPSPGQPSSKVGSDAATQFARPLSKELRAVIGDCSQVGSSLLGPLAVLQVSTGGPFTAGVPNGGPFAAPVPSHVYTYTLVGTGAPAAFRIFDDAVADNNGVLTITVGPVGTVSAVDASSSAPTSAAGGGQEGQSLLAARKACISRRRFQIRVVSPRKDPVVAATVRVNGTTVQVLAKKISGRSRQVSMIDLRGLPSGTARVTISARLKSGRVLKGSRAYLTCKPKRAGSKPKL